MSRFEITTLGLQRRPRAHRAQRTHGRGLSGLRICLEDGVRWGLGFGVFVVEDEDPLARQ